MRESTMPLDVCPHRPGDQPGLWRQLVSGGSDYPLYWLQIWMCVNEKLQFEDCDQACPGRGCHNANCAHPMLFPPPTGHSVA